MYAVIKTGGKQHKVKAGDVIEVEYLHGADDGITFKPLLVVDDDGRTHVGKDLDKAVVTAKSAGEQKGDKVRIFKYKNKTGYARRQGHRQLMTLLEISDVSLGSGAAKKPAAKKDEAPAGAEAES
jgi:large subunit ribosomal protein L21